MKKTFLILSVLVASYVVYITIVSQKEIPVVHPNGQLFAGTAKCAQCHSEIFKNFLTTAHHLTTQIADEHSIKGSLKKPDKNYWFNDHDKVVIEKQKKYIFQVGYSSGKFIGAHQFDIVIGSGTRGQSYIQWAGNKLLQLPLSYYANDHKWVTNPGNPTDRVVADRPVTAACLNCHATFFKTNYLLSGASEFDSEQIIYGVECERCHGPAATHVSSMINKIGKKNILNSAHMSRKLQLDACAQCHSGRQQGSLKMPFTFLPGDSLVSNSMYATKIDTSTNVDVHGNQYGMLVASKCFLESGSLPSTTCLNPTQQERGTLKLLSSRCTKCHQDNHEKECKLAGKLSGMISDNCIDCHMPLRASNKIAFRASGNEKKSFEIARTHFISIYPQEAKKILAALEKNIVH